MVRSKGNGKKVAASPYREYMELRSMSRRPPPPYTQVDSQRLVSMLDDPTSKRQNGSFSSYSLSFTAQLLWHSLRLCTDKLRSSNLDAEIFISWCLKNPKLFTASKESITFWLLLYFGMILYAGVASLFLEIPSLHVERSFFVSKFGTSLSVNILNFLLTIVEGIRCIKTLIVNDLKHFNVVCVL